MYASVDVIWTLVASFLVFFMQAGFTLVEAGFTRAKNAGNIIMKNLIDFCFGSVLYWFVGFGIMFGTQNAFFGGFHFFAGGMSGLDLPTPSILFFQTMFCATAATIVSGAMAERTDFKAYCIYSAIISLFIYPISGHWIWGDGFLAELGFHDFAGSTAVHMVGGVAAFIGAATLGPRIGKYDKNGNSQAIPGHNLIAAALGVFILWFAWFGFNGGSTTSMTGDQAILSASNILLNTNLAAAGGTVTALFVSWFRYKKPDITLTLNGSLAGLVGITAGCDIVTAPAAVLIGIISGIVMVFAVEFIDQKLKVDDPVGAVAVHGVCGALGTILTGFLAVDGGLFYGGGLNLVFTQILGVIVTALWVGITATILFLTIKHTVGLRVPSNVELEGLDNEEHGLATVYSGFSLQPEYSRQALQSFLDEGQNKVVTSLQKHQSISGEELTATSTPKSSTGISDRKLTTISVVINEVNLDALKTALENIGIEGITVTSVLGHGIQKGRTEYYRGSPVPATLLPKIKVDVTVSNIPVSTVVDAMKTALHTGKAGDGKIFITDVENVIRVSNNDEGNLALQGYEKKE
ncbi:ammonium transporter [Tetragenococcus halophilus]|uniref:ammonium transporter n=1 Tax=Tetragenococcus halophilus TaxID=51669 RepID=UPI002E18B15F